MSTFSLSTFTHFSGSQFETNDLPLHMTSACYPFCLHVNDQTLANPSQWTRCDLARKLRHGITRIESLKLLVSHYAPWRSRIPALFRQFIDLSRRAAAYISTESLAEFLLALSPASLNYRLKSSGVTEEHANAVYSATPDFLHSSGLYLSGLKFTLHLSDVNREGLGPLIAELLKESECPYGRADW